MEEQQIELEKKLMLFSSQRCMIFHCEYCNHILMLHATLLLVVGVGGDHGREQQDRA